MRNLLFCFFLLVISAWSVSAQNTDEMTRSDWATRTEIGYSFLSGSDAHNMQSTIKSLGSIKFNGDIQRRFYHHNVYFSGGIGYAITELRFDDPLIIQKNNTLDRVLVYKDVSPANHYGKSKLQFISMRLPLEIGIQTTKYHVAVGGYVGLVLTSKQKRKFETDGQHVRVNTFGTDKLGTSVLEYGVSARAGFRNFGFYGAFNLSPLFKNNGPNAQIAQIGVYFNKAYRTPKGERIIDKLDRGRKKI